MNEALIVCIIVLHKRMHEYHNTVLNISHFLCLLLNRALILSTNFDMLLGKNNG